MEETNEEYVENQMAGIDLNKAVVSFRTNDGYTKWLNWEDVLNYLIKKGIGE